MGSKNFIQFHVISVFVSIFIFHSNLKRWLADKKILCSAHYKNDKPIREAAKILGISKPHFLPLVKERKIRTVKIGRRILVSVQSLRDFVDGRDEPRNSEENAAELQGKKE